MHSVQPEQIGINVESESALAWVQTRRGQASNFRLRWLRRGIPWIMAQNAASVTSLEHLELIQEGSPTTVMLLMWLLAQASTEMGHMTPCLCYTLPNCSELISSMEWPMPVATPQQDADNPSALIANPA